MIYYIYTKIYRLVVLILENSGIEKSESKLAKLEEKKAALNAKIKLERNKLNAKKRKERTKRLIEKGAILEKLQGNEAASITPDQTLEWLKNNINTDSITTLKKRENQMKRLRIQLQSIQSELEFFKTTGQSWSFTNDDGSKTTVTERIMELRNSNER